MTNMVRLAVVTRAAMALFRPARIMAMLTTGLPLAFSISRSTSSGSSVSRCVGIRGAFRAGVVLGPRSNAAPAGWFLVVRIVVAAAGQGIIEKRLLACAPDDVLADPEEERTVCGARVIRAPQL
ncbi:hypothetical protein ACQF4J_47380 (plasmid) [Streptomyces sp. C1-1]|uniref:hypothetical protein n=1 Tax=Streptomyces sp. C1-1 TaxID=3231173 RepID=UPI003D01B172